MTRARKCPHRMADLLEHLVDQKCREGSCTLGAAARAEAPHLTACRHKELVAAVRASDASKTRLKPATVKVGVDDIVDEPSPEAVSMLEALLPNTLYLVVEGLDKAIQRRLLGIAGAIEANRIALCGQGKPPSLSQRGGAPPACPHFDQTARVLPHRQALLPGAYFVPVSCGMEIEQAQRQAQRVPCRPAPQLRCSTSDPVGPTRCPVLPDDLRELLKDLLSDAVLDALLRLLGAHVGDKPLGAF